MAPLMKLISQLGFLRLGGGSNKFEVDDDRVLHMFRKRPELKKSHISLQDEVQRLKGGVKQQEGATARVQEMLQGLEGRLSQPESGYPTLVFYQLRELWNLGRTLLTQFVTELAAQQEERERRAFFAEHNREQFERRQGIEAKLRDAENKAVAARDTVAQLEQELARLRQFWHFFKRRTIRQRLQTASLQSMLCMQDLEAARAGRGALDAEPTPEFGGLSIDARRAINQATIAYAQVLVERLARTPLMELARAASGRREPPRDEYGDRARCAGTLNAIVQGRGLLQQRGTLSQEIKQRSERVRELAKYRSAGETVPTAESLAVVAAGPEGASDGLVGVF